MDQARIQADLLVSGGYLYLQDQNRTTIKDGGVAILDDTIVETGPAVDLVKKYPDAERLDTKHGLIMPGLINTHTHAAMACFRGLADDLPLMQWLQEHPFPVKAELTADIVYQATLLSLAEMIKSGTTSFCDMYLFAKDVAELLPNQGCGPGSVRFVMIFHRQTMVMSVQGMNISKNFLPPTPSTISSI
jgi:5-methylthioadenosine/S-adenosylhomocysteine deaminase